MSAKGDFLKRIINAATSTKPPAVKKPAPKSLAVAPTKRAKVAAAPTPTPLAVPVTRVRKLAMDEASRMARAVKMGFDTSRTLYHGSPSGPIAEFDPSKIGSNFGYDKKGFFFTDNAREARNYSFKPEELTDKAFRMNKDNFPVLEARVTPAMLRMKNPLTLFELREHPDFIKADYNDPTDIYDNNRALIERLSEKYDGVDLTFRGQNISTVFDPKNIRSRFAAFDPDEIDSPDLLKAKGGRVSSLAVKRKRKR